MGAASHSLYYLFVVEVITREESRRALIGEDPVQKTRPRPRCDFCTILCHKILITYRAWWKKYFCLKNSHLNIEEYPSSSQLPHQDSTASTQTKNVSVKEHETHSTLEEQLDPNLSRKWPTPWYWQLLVLIVRTFKVSRHVITSKLNLVQTVLMAVVVSIIWFQIPEEEESIEDRSGYVSVEKLIITYFTIVCEYAVFFRSCFLEPPNSDTDLHIM